jgi:3-oxoacyl-[acyl-carrier protein] reductase
MKLDGKVVIVTGPSGGIGSAISRRLSSEGAIVAVNYRANAGPAEELAAALRNFGRGAQPFQADVNKLEDGRRLVDVKTFFELL